MSRPPPPETSASRRSGSEAPEDRAARTNGGEKEQPPPEFQFFVRGQVLYRHGLPIKRATVVASHVELRKEIELGRARTDDAGYYEISYRADAFPGQAPDLRVRAEDRRKKVLARSRVVFSAPRIAEVGLQVDGGPEKTWSEYEQLVAEITPMLDGAPISDLVEGDDEREISLVAGKIGQPEERVATLVVAHKLADRTGVDPAVYYGLARMGLPTNLSALLDADPESRQRALNAAVGHRVIPGRLVDRADELDAKIRKSVVEDIGHKGNLPLGEILAATLPDAKRRERFLTTYMKHDGPPEDFWRKLSRTQDLRRAVPDLQVSLQLAALSGGHAPLVKALLAVRREGAFTDFRELAQYSVTDWTRIVKKLPSRARVPEPIPGSGNDAVKLYAETIARIVEDTMPTEVLAYRASADGGLSRDEQRFWRNVTQTFADASRRFELGGVDLNTHLEKNRDLLTGVADTAQLVRNLQTTQRLFTLTTRQDELSALRSAGLDSSAKIARLGREVFVMRYGANLGAERAELIFNKAEHVASTAMAVLAEFSPQFNPIPLTPIAAPDVKQVPSLANLVGSLDLCACKECRAIGGPASYYAEILGFLRDRQLQPTPPTGEETALEVLLGRRPDLGELELTCENTNTVLPYVDLVNEILENAIAPFVPFTLSDARAAELDARTISPALRADFASNDAPLTDEHVAHVVHPNERWFVTDHSVLYVIERSAASNPTVRSATYQTAAPAKQLAANPEHIRPEAYEKLREALFPWELPLDVWREEVVRYLGHLRVDRHELMVELSVDGPWAAARRLDVGQEYLGLSDRERQIVTKTLPPGTADPWDFYGLAQTGNQVEVFDPANPEVPSVESLTWLKALAWVEVLLARSQLEYEELVELLTTAFVNPSGAVRIASADPADLATCDLYKLQLTGTDEAFFDRLHRFARLRRRLGWSAPELDRAIAVLGAGTADVNQRLSDDLVVKLSHVQRLRARLGRSIEELSVFWADIATDGEDSLYARLFQNPAVITPVDPDFALSGGEIAVAVDDPANAKISTHMATLLAACAVSAAELELLAEAVAPTDDLDLDALSAIYRRVLLARGLGFAVEDLLALVAMTGLDPFSTATADAVAFVELADQVTAAGSSVAELGYLLNHASAERIEWAPPEGAVASVLEDLRTALRKVREETVPRADPTGDLTRSTLAALRWPVALVDSVIATLSGPDTPAAHQFVESSMRAFEWPAFSADLAALPAAIVAFPDDLRRRIYYDSTKRALVFAGVMTDAEKAALDQLSAAGAYRTAVQTLYDAPAAYVPPDDDRFFGAGEGAALFAGAATPAERFEVVLRKLLAHLRRTGSVRVVTQQLAENLGMTLPNALRLLTETLHADGSATEPAMADFLSEVFAASDPGEELTAAGFAAQFNTYVRLVKAVRLATALRLEPAELDWLNEFGPGVAARQVPWLTGGPAVGWLRLDDLPVASTAPSVARFAAWFRVVELTRLRDSLPGGFATLRELLELGRKPGVPAAAARQLLLDAVHERTGWDPDAIDFLSSGGVLALAFPADLADETGLSRMHAAVRRVNGLGASAQQCHAFAATTLTEADGDAAVQLVKSKYGEPDWLTIAEPLRNALRERQRDALLAYLVAGPDPAQGQAWKDANGVYEHFLIDVQMSSCMSTSRLKQAISSTQQFVQRCLLNLESKVVAHEATDPGWREWKFRSSFRVHQANMTTFLYPESYLEPELRDDKSPIFRAAESELMQNEVTPEVAEQVFMTYLEQLDDVARLELAGLYLQPAADGNPEVLHVFGRTPGSTTPAHYYRRRTNGHWTAWAKIDLDISEPQLLPIVWNRRLYLFWPVITEEESPPRTIPDKPGRPVKYYRIALAWSEYKRGKWQPKRVTSQTVAPSLLPYRHPKSQHVLRASIRSDGLYVWYEIDYEKTIAATMNMPFAFAAGPHGTTTTDENVVEIRDVKEGTAVRALEVDGWRFTGCEGRTEPFSTPIQGIFEPSGTSVDGMRFVEQGENPLSLPTAGDSGDAVALNNTPGRFELAYLHQDGYLTGLRPFFYADDGRTYFVESVEARKWILDLPFKDFVEPIVINEVRRHYYEPVVANHDDAYHPGGPNALHGVSEPVPIAQALIASEAAQPAAAGGTATVGATIVQPPKRTVGENLILAKGDKGVFTVGEYTDDRRIDDLIVWGPFSIPVRHYQFHNFFHPYTCPFMKQLNATGVDGLLRRETQLQSAKTFRPRYNPTNLVVKGDPATFDKYPVEDVDFSYGAAYSIYNWELFFHLPLLIATRLSQNQRFDEARRWFHFIFDPTDTSDDQAPRRYWRTKPFFEQSQPDVAAQRIDRIITMLAQGVVDPELQAQVDEWRRSPFKPHAIARLRLAAYMKNVLMRYMDNELAHADMDFRNPTLESINRAEQRYVTVEQLLGPEPAMIEPRAEPQVQTFNSLDPQLEALSDELVDIEYLFGGARSDSVVADPNSPPLPLPRMLYFCVPPNEKLLRYWDTVRDRLSNLRHCKNIEGAEVKYQLWEPKIAPELLVRATAVGVDIATALSDAAAPLPTYRFSALASRADQLVNDVKALGQSLLQALERKDTEGLALIRARNAVTLEDAVEEVKSSQLKEAKEQIEVLRKAREISVTRYLNFLRLLGDQNAQVPAEGAPIPERRAKAAATVASAQGVTLIRQEASELEKLSEAQQFQAMAGMLDAQASLAHMTPDVAIDAKPWGVGSGVTFGGSNLGPGLQAASRVISLLAAERSFEGTRSGRLATLVLREHDYVNQANLAAKEIMHIDAQIIAAEIRAQVAEQELASHRLRMRHARDEVEFIKEKFTSEELAGWMVGKISEVYFQGYRLAYDACRKAQRAYCFELGLDDCDFIQFGYWDSLKKGLLAGDQLQLDLRRMEMAHLDANKREHELTKHVSLELLRPQGLVELGEQGACFVELPEAIFDLDHPGHYMRRIKSVSLTIPCTTGPYTTVSCKLTLLANRVRKSASAAGQYGWRGQDDSRFRHDSGGAQSIVTSSGRDDPGLFQLDFGDERYLPFEGAGVVSLWRLELPEKFRQFDYSTISDVVMHMRYTARDGGSALRDAATNSLTTALKNLEVAPGTTGLFRLVMARSELPDAFHRLLHPPPTAAEQELSFVLDKDRFPTHLRDRAIKISSLTVFVRLADGVAYDSGDPLVATVRRPSGISPADVTFNVSPTQAGGLPAGTATFAAPGVALSPTNPWRIVVKDIPAALGEDVDVDGATVRRLKPDAVKDVGILCTYTF